MSEAIDWQRMYCQRCALTTDHRRVPNVQGLDGVIWRCEPCRLAEEFSAYTASPGNRI